MTEDPRCPYCGAEPDGECEGTGPCRLIEDFDRERAEDAALAEEWGEQD